MTAVAPLRAAGETDQGLQRAGNEDQFHVDAGRGLFMVIDGVGGQAAGRQAATVALAMLRARLERETGPLDERVREAITVANNEIHRLARTRPEWTGMACVLTVAIVKDGLATIGHVGDTRLYKIRGQRIEKVTRDHSPIGEREDAGELSETEAMRHPRRNEVYRDVGSEPHQSDDPDFVDLQTIGFEDDAALLLCSDGLSDLVQSSTISRIVAGRAGDPHGVVQALIGAANAAGGKDNVTAVYVEGERFAASSAAAPHDRRSRRMAVLALVLALLGLVMMRPPAPRVRAGSTVVADATPPVSWQVVRPGESIAAALARAAAGSQVVVEPGEYREQLSLKEGVRVVSRIPRAATIRLPATDSEDAAAVVAERVSNATLAGFRIVGDAATPLGVGVRVVDAALSIVDVEVIGASTAAIELAGAAGGTLIGSEVHDNPGAALVIRSGASPRISHNTFARNGLSARAAASFSIEPGANPVFWMNVFQGVGPEVMPSLDGDARRRLTQDNWFPGISRPGHGR